MIRLLLVLNLQESTAAEDPDYEAHRTKVGEPNFDGFPELGIELVICLRVVENVDSCGAQEGEVKCANHSELDRRLPF